MIDDFPVPWLKITSNAYYQQCGIKPQEIESRLTKKECLELAKIERKRKKEKAVKIRVGTLDWDKKIPEDIKNVRLARNQNHIERAVKKGEYQKVYRMEKAHVLQDVKEITGLSYDSIHQFERNNYKSLQITTILRLAIYYPGLDKCPVKISTKYRKEEDELWLRSKKTRADAIRIMLDMNIIRD